MRGTGAVKAFKLRLGLFFSGLEAPHYVYCNTAGGRGLFQRICFLRRQVLELLDWCSSEQDPKHLGDLDLLLLCV
jgi:hypothetical protein